MSNRTLHGDKATLNCPKVKQHRELTQELHKLYSDKNADYGDSFHKVFEQYGLLSAVIQMKHKMNRLEELQANDNRVDESIRDTLMDLAGYCLLTILEIEEPSEEITDYARIMSGWTDASKVQEYHKSAERISSLQAEEFRQAMQHGDETGEY